MTPPPSERSVRSSALSRASVEAITRLVASLEIFHREFGSEGGPRGENFRGRATPRDGSGLGFGGGRQARTPKLADLPSSPSALVSSRLIEISQEDQKGIREMKAQIWGF